MAERPLEQVADTAEQVAEDQRDLARQARQMQGQLDQGWSWSQVLDDQPSPGIVAKLRKTRLVVASLAAGLSATVARELSREGHSRRQIAGRLQVTHQRVSALLRNGDRDGEAV